MSLESRRAVDSTGEPMDDTVTIRMSHDLRLCAGRRARANGFDNFGEYVRWLIRQDVDSSMVATLQDDAGNFVLRNAEPSSLRTGHR